MGEQSTTWYCRAASDRRELRDGMVHLQRGRILCTHLTNASKMGNSDSGTMVELVNYQVSCRLSTWRRRRIDRRSIEEIVGHN